RRASGAGWGPFRHIGGSDIKRFWNRERTGTGEISLGSAERRSPPCPPGRLRTGCATANRGSLWLALVRTTSNHSAPNADGEPTCREARKLFGPSPSSYQPTAARPGRCQPDHL